MTLDPYTAAFLRRMRATHPDLGATVTDPDQARRIQDRARYPRGPQMAQVTNLTADGVPVRIYRPAGPTGPLPVVVYLHGGGWVLCGLDTHDGVCRQLADRAKVLVVSVDYRLAPEHPFPAAPDDAYTATCWVQRRVAQWGGDPDRLAVAGDSAGGALAAATCLRARDLGFPRIAYQLLVYPVTDCLAPRTRDDTHSLLTAEHMRWYVARYLRHPSDGEHPYASPLRAPDLGGLPPALVLLAEHDPLRDEGEAYAVRLAEHGVPVETHLVEGLFHGLFGLGDLVPVGRRAETLAVAGLRAALRGDAHV